MRVTSALMAFGAVGMGAIMSGNMSFEEIFSFVFLMACSLGAYALIQRLRLSATLNTKGGKRGEKAVDKRLDELERRLTDVQDIMLAVNDKLERFEALPPVGAARPDTAAAIRPETSAIRQ